MHQSGALQGVVGPLGSKEIVSQTAEFLIDDRDQGAERLVVAFLPMLQKLSELTRLIIEQEAPRGGLPLEG